MQVLGTVCYVHTSAGNLLHRHVPMTGQYTARFHVHSQQGVLRLFKCGDAAEDVEVPKADT